ncbi:hypothetical protein ACIQNU_03325 [Streptomyces sp. NPDC091292]
MTHRRAAWRWAFVDRFRLSLADYDALTIDQFESGIAYIEQTIAASAQPP